MGYLPDWFMNYGNAPGSVPVSSGPAMPPGSSPPRLPQWLMSYGNDPKAAQGAQYNDVDNVPYDPTTGPNNSSQAMRGAPAPPVAPAIPPAMRATFPAQGPIPPHRPGGNWDTTTALEGETPTSALPDWATPGAQNAAASEDRQIGPGSWLNPDRLGKMIDPNSLVGKLLAMRNPSSAPAPVGQPQEQGLLAPLFAEGGLFGRDPTTPNSTTGGLW